MVFSHSQNLVISPSNQSLNTCTTNYLQIIRIRFVGSTATMIKFALCASSVSQHIFFPVSSPKQDPQNKVLYLHIIYHEIEKISSDRFPGSQHSRAKFKIILVRKPERKLYFFHAKILSKHNFWEQWFFLPIFDFKNSVKTQFLGVVVFPLNF